MRFLLAILSVMIGCGLGMAAEGADKVRAGFVYVGPVGDAGWTFSHDQGRKAMEELPYVEESTYIESVPEGAGSARVINRLARRGHNLIFTNSFGYMDATIDVARQFPDITFMHCSGYKTADNVGTYFGRMYQPRYLSGIIAGAMTDANTLGYVAAFPIPEVIRGINAFALGAQVSNPDARVRVVWTQTWFDPGKERQAAESLLDMGADVITMHQDTPAPLQAAEARGAWAIGYNSDMRRFAPNAFLTAPVWDWGVVYREIAEEVHEGTWEPRQIWWGLKEGLVGLAEFSDQIPAETLELVAQHRAEIEAGTRAVFQGPLLDQEGAERLAANEQMTDEQMLQMNFFVQGVQGSLGN